MTNKKWVYMRAQQRLSALRPGKPSEGMKNYYWNKEFNCIMKKPGVRHDS